jgi:hypothetical protein
MQIRHQLNVPGFLAGLVRDLDIRYVLVDTKTASPELLAAGGVFHGDGLRKIHVDGHVILFEVVRS